jgi:16S rRNA U1498 N3-methylase RsmE
MLNRLAGIGPEGGFCPKAAVVSRQNNKEIAIFSVTVLRPEGAWRRIITGTPVI